VSVLATEPGTTNYSYESSSPSHTDSYLWPTVERVLANHFQKTNPRRVFDLGCGNGSFAARLTELGYSVTGVDPSASGIEQANRQWPNLELRNGSAYDDLRSRYGTFPAVVSLEVVEHVYAPRDYAKCIADLLEPRGIAIVSTPYHGYWKNLALALTGQLDRHFTALWDHGHIKFWSIRTLTHLLNEVGLQVEQVHRVGRLPTFAKSMILVARKPA
jgi:2-polyprenyl-6-hydroxyphenyl methylase/3-demethylubiquinone-9 3-methyltransferase